MGDTFTHIGFAGLLLAEVNLESIMSIILMCVLIISGLTTITISIIQALRNDSKIDSAELSEIKSEIDNFNQTLQDINKK